MENNKKQKISIPTAIIIAGLFIMVGILLTKTNYKPTSSKNAPKTLSEQVGISKSQLDSCIKNTNASKLNTSIKKSVADAMSGVPQNQRGTPYSVIIGPNGIKAEIRGAYPYSDVQTAISEVVAGKVVAPYVYTGKIDLPTSSDHVYGNPNAPMTIIEYSDFECPYCKAFHPTLKKIVDESNGNIKWIYRYFPIHQDSFAELVAAECVSKIKGNDAFWKYGDLLFGLQKESANAPSISSQL